MHISKHTDYALRTLMYLGLKNIDERISIREVSDFFDISHNHLMKIVQKLSAASYIDGRRGKGGGIRLAKQPKDINVGEVFRELEPKKPVVDCGTEPCRFKGNCKLERAISRAMQAFFDTLSDYTLEDVLSDRGQLIRVLVPSITVKMPKMRVR